MARAHQLLAKQHWHAVSLADMLRTQIHHDISHRVILLGEDVLISSNIVQPLALVVHELLSNAELYGGLAGDDGKVELSCTVSEATLKLRWNEGPLNFSSSSHVEKFGLEIVRNLVENQLKGRMSRNLVNGKLVVDIDLMDVSDPN